MCEGQFHYSLLVVKGFCQFIHIELLMKSVLED